MSIGRALLLGLLCGLSVACATGTAVKTSQVTKITPGVTTQAEIQSWFGEPDQREILGSEGTRWFYVHQSGSRLDAANNAVSAANVGLEVFRSVGDGVGMRLPSMPGARNRSTETSSLEVSFGPDGVVRDYAYQGR